LLLVGANAARAATGGGSGRDVPLAAEPWNTGWAFYVDNDALALVNRDQQYTGGFALTLSGRRATAYALSLQPALTAANRLTGFSALGTHGPHLERHAMQLAIAAFTPANIRTSRPIRDDRPYASLLMLGNTQQVANLDDHVVYQSSLILGLLGTNVARDVQNAIHRAGGFRQAKGWDNQISAGGEPTGLYVATRYDTVALHVDQGGPDYQVQTSVGGALGFATEAGIGVAGRWGRIETPWWDFVPDYAEYASLGTPISSRVQGDGSANDLFVWGGLSLRYRLYNALLEGQFRHSEVTFRRDELRSLLAEASLGVTAGLGGGTYLSFVLRARTPELRDVNNGFPLWGGLVLAQVY